jgi:hypothetical protein
VTEEAGRHLGVKELTGQGTACPLQNLEILIGGVGNHDAGATEYLGQWCDVDLQRVDQSNAAWTAVGVGPGNLNQR